MLCIRLFFTLGFYPFKKSSIEYELLKTTTKAFFTFQKRYLSINLIINYPFPPEVNE